MERERLDKKQGQMLVGMMLTITVLALLVSLMVLYVRQESVWSVKASKNTTAFHLAEAGEEKGFLAVSLSSPVWTALQNGNDLPGFRFDQTYSDVSGGTYTVSVTSGPASGEVTILSVGRDAAQKEIRALKTIYSESALTAPMYANGISMAGANNNVEWGPVISQSAISMTAAGTLSCYPQIWAVGAISNSSASNKCFSCVSNYSSDIRCTNPSWSNNSSNPCTDNVSWWSNNCAPGVPPPPTINLAAYKAMALADTCNETISFGSFSVAANPAGALPNTVNGQPSCYWPNGTAPTWANSNFVPVSTHTYYTDDATGFALEGANNCFRGAMIVANPTASLQISGAGGGCPTYAIPDWLSPHGIPAQAWKQYQLIDTPAASDYYGDAGSQQVVTAPPINGTFTFGAPSGTSKQNGITSNTYFRGFIYVGSGNFQFSTAGTLIHGVIYSPQGASGITGGTLEIFYDQDVAANIQTTASKPSRIWWQDIVVPQWPGP